MRPSWWTRPSSSYNFCDLDGNVWRLPPVNDRPPDNLGQDICIDPCEDKKWLWTWGCRPANKILDFQLAVISLENELAKMSSDKLCIIWRRKLWDIILHLLVCVPAASDVSKARSQGCYLRYTAAFMALLCVIIKRSFDISAKQQRPDIACVYDLRKL